MIEKASFSPSLSVHFPWGTFLPLEFVNRRLKNHYKICLLKIDVCLTFQSSEKRLSKKHAPEKKLKVVALVTTVRVQCSERAQVKATELF